MARIHLVVIHDVKMNRCILLVCHRILIIGRYHTTNMLVRAATQECLDKKQELQDYIKDQNMGLYRKLRRSLFGRVSNLPGRGGRKMFVAAYKICQKFYGFN